MSLDKKFYYKSNKLQQLRGFYYVAQYNNIAKASALLHLSPSTVSIQIKSLEESLSVVLFNRTGSSIQLNAIGKRFFSHIEPLVLQLDSVFEDFSTKEESAPQKLTIASQTIFSLYDLPKKVKAFKEKYSQADVTIINCTIDECINLTDNKEVDLVCGCFFEIPSHIKFTPINYYEPVLIFHKAHPLAKLKKIKMKDVAKYDFIHIDREHFTLPHFKSALDRYNIKSKIRLKNATWLDLMAYVEGGFACACVSSICKTNLGEDIISYPLSEYFPKMPYGYITTRDQRISYLAKIFLDFSQS